MRLAGGKWKIICHPSVLDSSAVTSILGYSKDTLLISTLKNGLYLYSNGKLARKRTDIDPSLFNDRIYCASRVNSNWFALGTTSGGVAVIDRSGRLIQKYSYLEGLQQNNIRATLIDQNGGLWLALDDGIDFISVNSAIKYIFPDKNKQITGYAMRVYNNNLYIGSSNGLYCSPLERGVRDISFSRGEFFEMSNTEGQVWNLDEINGALLMGHEDGLFTIRGSTARQVYSFPGTWMFQDFSTTSSVSEILAGTYLGLQNLVFKNGTVKNLGHIEGLYETLRFIVYEKSENVVWASNPYRGIFKLVLSGDHRKILKTKIYTSKDGLPTTLYNYVFKIRGKIAAATQNGIYVFNEHKNKFEPFPVLNKALRGIALQYLKEDSDGNIWFVTNKKVGVLDFHKTSNLPYSVVYIPELNGKVVGGFESIYYKNSENVFIGSNKGVVLINYEKYRNTISKPGVVLGMVKIRHKKDSTIFGGYFVNDKGIITDVQSASSVKSLDHQMNSVHFEYASTLFDLESNIEFSYQLIGFDQDWSDWSSKAEKDYTNLPPGDYIFKVRARYNKGNVSEPVSYAFTIAPAWYESSASYIVYFLLIGYGLYRMLQWQEKKYKRQKENLEYMHQLELDRTEKEIVRLRNDQLKADVNFKNRELAAMTMHLAHRGEVLSKVKEVISSLLKKHDLDGEKSPSVRALLRLIREVDRSEDWEQFSVYFNNVNAEFFSLLKNEFPDITSNELKLCAYIKMNLSSKEIAQMMNVTIKAVEVGRYRLRKKLKLSPEVNLYDFLLQLGKKQ